MMHKSRDKLDKRYSNDKYDRDYRFSSKKSKHREDETERNYKSSKIHRTENYDRKKKRKDADIEAIDSRYETVDNNYSITKNTYEFNKVFSSNPNLVQDTQDFWQFVQKYESVQKKLGPKKDSCVEESFNSIGLSPVYNKSNNISIKLSPDFDEIIACVPKAMELGAEKIKKFKNVIILYLDFKQKEKFNKLRKLRTDQANLPVAQYKSQIVQAVREKSVVIIAGDTGCGKSTQVPQYLYSSGFEKIGNFCISLLHTFPLFL